MHTKLSRAALALALLAAPLAEPPSAQGLIRDAEIENTIDGWVGPLVENAGFQKSEVRFHIIPNPRVNAFVTGGKQIFLTTGLLASSAHPGQVMGVVAHELGHITGGHLVRLSTAAQDAGFLQAVGVLIGAAGGIASGEGDAILAGVLMGQNLAERSFTTFTRAQERSADQVAVDLLDKVGVSSRGLLELMETLENRELLAPNQRDPYLRTHPLTRDRISFVENHVRSSAGGRTFSAADLLAHRRVVAKLKGFLDVPERTLRAYRESDDSVEARYARSIALYRSARLDEALELIDGLISEAPDDPYYPELRGQVLFENGRMAEARRDYERSLRLLPDEPLFLAGLAHVYLELGRSELTGKAVGLLEKAVRKDRMMATAWRLSAIAYGRAGKLGLSALSSAEHALLAGRREQAAYHARKALRLLPAGSPARLRARDIFVHTDPAAAKAEADSGKRERKAPVR